MEAKMNKRRRLKNMNSKKAILEEVIPMRQYQRRKLRIVIQLTRF
jgi:hypothetical protein